MDSTPVTREEFEALRDAQAESLRVSQANNHLLLRMQYWGRVAFWAKVVIWTIVLVIPVILYSHLSPFINILPGGGGSTTNGTTTSLFGFPAPSALTTMFHSTPK